MSEAVDSDPLGLEFWRSIGVEPDVTKSRIRVSATRCDILRYPYRPTVDGSSDDLVFIDTSPALLTAHDVLAIHQSVRGIRSHG